MTLREKNIEQRHKANQYDKLERDLERARKRTEQHQERIAELELELTIAKAREELLIDQNTRLRGLLAEQWS